MIEGLALSDNQLEFIRRTILWIGPRMLLSMQGIIVILVISAAGEGLSAAAHINGNVILPHSQSLERTPREAGLASDLIEMGMSGRRRNIRAGLLISNR